MVVKRVIAALVAVVAIATAAAIGCGGLSAGDSAIRCNAEAQAKVACYDGPDGSVYGSCLSCYERCGNDCTPQETCPETYLCPGDPPTDAGTK
jgi:hypothetical protein